MTIKIEDLRIVIQVEGGVVQNICSNSPVPIKVYIVDYDTEGADLDELMTTSDGDKFVGHSAIWKKFIGTRSLSIAYSIRLKL